MSDGTNYSDNYHHTVQFIPGEAPSGQARGLERLSTLGGHRLAAHRPQPLRE